MFKYMIGLFILCFTFNAKTQDLTLEVVSEHWPPFIIQNAAKAEDVSGIVTKKVHEILAPTNISYTINTYPWARSYHLATTRPNVLIYSIYKTKKREPHFTWFCPIYSKTPVNIYKLKTNNINIGSLASLEKANVGVLRNDNSHNYMLNNGFAAGQNLTVSGSEESNIRNLLNGKIDAVIQSREALIYRLQDSGFDIDDFEVGFQLHQDMSSEHCMALSKSSSPELVKAVTTAFNTWLAKQKVLTSGLNHIGLTVKNLSASSDFFIDTLGWTKAGGYPDYPSVFVTDGSIFVTLWQTKSLEHVVEFNRKNNVGLHHLALTVNSEEALHELHQRFKLLPNVVIEFAPELNGKGPTMHMMIREPSGNRIEFAYNPLN